MDCGWVSSGVSWKTVGSTPSGTYETMEQVRWMRVVVPVPLGNPVGSLSRSGVRDENDNDWTSWH